jgi:uncharacterized membrane protein
MYYLNTFFIYSILGYLFESIIYLFCKGESGILYGPWTPVYGLGVVIIYIFYNYLNKKNYSLKYIYILEFLVGFFILSFIEWIGGHLLESFFKITFWNYEGLLFNIGKYISLEISLVWGILSCICIKFLKPLSDKLIKKIPKLVTFIFLILFIIDIFITCSNKMKLSIFLFPFF